MRRTGTAAAIAGLIAVSTVLAGAPAVPLVAGPVPPAPPTGRAAAATYHYAEAIPQRLRTKRTGAVATFTVHHPRQVGSGSHSLAELAVAPNAETRSYVEAGWIVSPGRRTRLFIFWWRNGKPHCYNFGCGFVDRGRGMRPGTALRVGSSIRLAWKHRNAKWFLFVNGKQSGFYPDRLWGGTFTGTKWFQVFGEIADGVVGVKGTPGATIPVNPRSAKVTDVAYVDGPPVRLSVGHTTPRNNYRVKMTSSNSFRYGGPGRC